MSTIPAMLSSEGLFSIPFPAFESDFMPWNYLEPSFDFQHQQELINIISPNQTQEPVIFNSGSDNSNPIIPPSPDSGSYEPNRNKNNSTPAGSDKSNREVTVPDERKQRRMISNRESAKRSRMRKQKHLENVRSQVNRLKISNRELMNRLRVATHHCRLVGNENGRLRSEAVMLRQTLWDIRQVLLVRQLQQQLAASSAWPCNNFTSVNEQIPQSLIT